MISGLKQFHVALALLTFVGFFVRGVWMMQGSALLQHRVVRVFPHVIDTFLLLTGIALAIMIHQYPLAHGWLTAKLVALLVYIGLGTIAIRRGKTKTVRILAWIGALAVFAYIVAVALAHSPNPFPVLALALYGEKGE
jgi:uncharacterized membrane protein SirB2